MKSGIELISEEREKQIKRWGGPEEDALKNSSGQLALGARGVMTYKSGIEAPANSTIPKDIIDQMERMREEGWQRIREMGPPGWDDEIWKRMLDQPIKQRLIMAGALIAAEIDRIQFMENLPVGEQEKVGAES